MPGSEEYRQLGKRIFLQGAYMATVTRQKPPAPKRGAVPPPRKPAGPVSAKGKVVAKSKPKASFVPAKGYDFEQLYPDGLNARGSTTVVCYGPSGVGKTSIWSFLPDVGILYDPKDEGIADLVRFGQCPTPKWMHEAKDFENTLELLANVANQEYDIKHLVLDSLTGFELFCFQYHCAENFENDWSKNGFYAFMSGPKNAAKTDWPRLLDALDDVRRAGISVVAIAHSQIKPVNNPDGENYDQHMPYLDKETWQQTHRWAKAVLFYNVEVGLEKKGNKAKAKAGSEERAIYTDLAATFIAKNRWGIEPRIDAGGSAEDAYNAFMKAYMEAGQ